MYMKDWEYCGFPEKQPVHVRSHGKIAKSCKKICFLLPYIFFYDISFVYS